MVKPKKNQDRHKLPESLPDLLKYYAGTLRKWSEVKTVDSDISGWRTKSSLGYLRSAGASIRVLLGRGAFPEIGNRLLPIYDSFHVNRDYLHGYTKLWDEFVRKLKTGKYLSAYSPNLKTFNDDCRFVAAELEKKAHSICMSENNRSTEDNTIPIPELRKSPPLSKTAMAKLWGGDMSPKKLSSLMDSGKVKAVE